MILQHDVLVCNEPLPLHLLRATVAPKCFHPSISHNEMLSEKMIEYVNHTLMKEIFKLKVFTHIYCKIRENIMR